MAPSNWQATEDTVTVASAVDGFPSFGCVQLTPRVAALFSSDPPSTVVVWVLVNVSVPVPVTAPSVAVMSQPTGLVFVTVMAAVPVVPFSVNLIKMEQY